MYTAVARRTDSGQVIGPEQRVSREDALRMTTIDAAWLSFDEKSKGSIEVGKLGDLAILSDDYLTCDEERIKEIRSVLTIVGGGSYTRRTEERAADREEQVLLERPPGIDESGEPHRVCRGAIR